MFCFCGQFEREKELALKEVERVTEEVRPGIVVAVPLAGNLSYCADLTHLNFIFTQALKEKEDLKKEMEDLKQSVSCLAVWYIEKKSCVT